MTCRSAKLSYNLTNPGSATITTIKAVLKQDGQVVQTLDIPSTTLTADLTNLDYYKPYTLTTTMTFDRGNGEESQVLADQTLQLDLKKVELKDFARTDLIKYDNQTEVDETRLTAVPQDLTNYYLKLTSADQKTTYLAVKAIEETTVDGKAVYKGNCQKRTIWYNVMPKTILHKPIAITLRNLRLAKPMSTMILLSWSMPFKQIHQVNLDWVKA